MLALYNSYSLKIILGGKCLEFKTITKIDASLLIFLRKELELLLMLVSILKNHKLINEPNKTYLLVNDISQHRQNLISNVYALVSETIRIQSENLEEYNWEDNTYRFLSPSVESCNLINYITEMVKKLHQFLRRLEFE